MCLVFRAHKRQGNNSAANDGSTRYGARFSTQGYTESDIKNGAAWNQQFKITFNYEYNADYEAGTVYAQSVKAGETVPQGSAIVLTVSKGTEMATVPDVGTLTADEATKQLENLGFKVKTVSVYNNGNYTPNTVKNRAAPPRRQAKALLRAKRLLFRFTARLKPPPSPQRRQQPHSNRAFFRIK